MNKAGQPVPLDALTRFARDALTAIGADAATVDAAARAMLHGSRFGVDSHGFRLLPHYAGVMEAGRVAVTPGMTVVCETAATAVLDACNGHGALAAYRAMDKSIALARNSGAGCVSIRNSSHFGPAGAFAMKAAEAGMIGFVTCHSDAFVRLHDGAAPFHGTNPLAWAAPTRGQPWFFDMATSAVPYNRVMLHRSFGMPLPAGVASDAEGADTRDADLAAMLVPLGGAFGFKGAGLAGVATIFSAMLAGMAPDAEILPMAGPDMTSPRGLGAFCMAIDPEAFLPREVFLDGMERYLSALRSSRARDERRVMAPGDREWAEAARRERDGAPVDPDTAASFHALSKRLGIELPGALKTDGI